MEGAIITMQDLLTFYYAAGRDEKGRFRGGLISTGLRPKFAEDLHDQGIELAANLFVRGV
jgi:pilus assembly protein CpaF